jgi:hypothetical protein
LAIRHNANNFKLGLQERDAGFDQEPVIVGEQDPGPGH